jgi:hypothetical protein
VTVNTDIWHIIVVSNAAWKTTAEKLQRVWPSDCYTWVHITAVIEVAGYSVVFKDIKIKIAMYKYFLP